jgi:TonB family protein
MRTLVSIWVVLFLSFAFNVNGQDTVSVNNGSLERYVRQNLVLSGNPDASWRGYGLYRFIIQPDGKVSDFVAIEPQSTAGIKDIMPLVKGLHFRDVDFPTQQALSVGFEGSTLAFVHEGVSAIYDSIYQSDDIFTIVEEMPDYNGGLKEMNSFINQNMRYPSLPLEIHLEGTVYIGFIIDENGMLSNVSLMRGVESSMNEEALRIVKSMPAWNPGKQRGMLVKLQHYMPIRFKIKKQTSPDLDDSKKSKNK